jgi:FkbM family methyltransferase
MTIISIIENDEYELNNFSNIKTIIDIGAHIGAFSIFAKNKFPNANVFAYEPSPVSYKLLQDNIELNILNNVNTFQSAVSDKRGIAELSIFPNSNWSDSLLTSSIHTVRVLTVTLEDIFKVNKIDTCDILKIDTEGSEWNILSVLPKEIFNRINSIIIETHDFIQPEMTEKIKNLLETNNFICQFARKTDNDTSIIIAKTQ